MRRLLIVSALLCTFASIHAASPERKQESAKEAHEVHEFDRGITMSTSTFIPKGTFGAGLTLSYNTMDLGKASDDPGFSLLSLITGIKGDMYTFGVAPNVSYFLLDNLLQINPNFIYQEIVEIHQTSVFIFLIAVK